MVEMALGCTSRYESQVQTSDEDIVRKVILIKKAALKRQQDYILITSASVKPCSTNRLSTYLTILQKTVILL